MKTKKRYKASENINNYTDTYSRDWVQYCELVASEAIKDCIDILEDLHDQYDKYHERVALKNAIRHLNIYKNS